MFKSFKEFLNEFELEGSNISNKQRLLYKGVWLKTDAVTYGTYIAMSLDNKYDFGIGIGGGQNISVYILPNRKGDWRKMDSETQNALCDYFKVSKTSSSLFSELQRLRFNTIDDVLNLLINQVSNYEELITDVLSKNKIPELLKTAMEDELEKIGK